MAEAGLLDSLITDLYWPQDRSWASYFQSLSPSSVRSLLNARCDNHLPSNLVRPCWWSGAAAFGISKFRFMPFALQRKAIRWSDSSLGRCAGKRASKNKSALLSYSYYGFSSFSHFKGTQPRILFQLHPHPASIRTLLSQEMELHPECRESLAKEWELGLPEEDFHRLVEETKMAQHWLAASSYTRQTLVENGIDPQRIHVVPYGVNLQSFQPPKQSAAPSSGTPLRILFVGTINQRKGISYLVDAVRKFSPKQVSLTVCGRVVDNLQLFRDLPQATVRPSVSSAELLEAYQSADLFVFPSLAEGFGHVLLESLACGLPVLSTTHTAAPDLLTEGQDGFVIAPRSVDAITEKLEWAIEHRAELHRMKQAARAKAERFTWAAFRQGVVKAAQAANTVPYV